MMTCRRRPTPSVADRLRLALAIFSLGVAWMTPLAARADDVLPKAFPASRYAKLGAHSPFSPPTAAVAVPIATAAPAGSWADKLSVTLLMEQGGKYVATVVDRDSSEHFLVTTDGGSNEKNMTLSSVQWGDKPNQTRVTIRKGTEFGQVAFDPSATAASSASAPALPSVFPRPAPPGGFHPPPASNAGFNGPRTPGMIVRRPPISSAPAPTLNNPRNPLGRATTQTSDDDDDDDN